MTDNTPLNADELDKILTDIYERLATEDTGISLDYFLEDTGYKKRIKSLCEADRKKHELQAVLKELKWAKTASVWNIEVRISELEKELERL